MSSSPALSSHSSVFRFINQCPYIASTGKSSTTSSSSSGGGISGTSSDAFDSIGLQDITKEDFIARFNAFATSSTAASTSTSSKTTITTTNSTATTTTTTNNTTSELENCIGAMQSIVLSYSTKSTLEVKEKPFFTLVSSSTKKSWSIGRDAANDVSLPHDLSLLGNRQKYIRYATIAWAHGHFFLVSPSGAISAPPSGAISAPPSAQQSPGAPSRRKSYNKESSEPQLSVSKGILDEEVIAYKLGNKGQRTITIDDGVKICVGSSIILCNVYDDGLLLTFLSGPLVREDGLTYKFVNKTFLKPVVLGRSPSSLPDCINFEDKEVSRTHCVINYIADRNVFELTDKNSTNGTYILLSGPNSGNYKLDLGDNIRIGKTCFNISRFDFGSSEEIGVRPTMEDAMSNVQDLRIDALHNTPLLSPQSFFGVFDGHVGGLASIYLEEHLHANICRDISSIAPSLLESIKEIGTGNSDAEWRSIDEIVQKTLVATYLATDNDFISTSEKPEHGSTATTAFMLGNRLYVANVGDSRVFLCRNKTAHPMTEDHKPNRPDELKRIQAAGGYVINKRVMGELSVSRTFGDSGFKTGMQGIVGDDIDGDPDDPNRLVKLRSSSHVDKGAWDTPLIVAEPEIRVTSITSQDQFLLLACDGLFDVFNYDEITAFILEQMSNHQNARICCENLTHEAISVRKSKDNVSVLLIILNKWY